MRFYRFSLPICVATLGFVLLLFAGWLLFTEPRKGPLEIKVVKASMVRPAPGATLHDNFHPYELLEFEIRNASSHLIRASGMQLRPVVRPVTVLAAEYGTNSLVLLKPGESVRRTMRAYGRHKSGLEWKHWRPKFVYMWEYADLTPGNRPLKFRLREKYNEFRAAVLQRLKIELPRATQHHPAEIEIVVPPHAETP